MLGFSIMLMSLLYKSTFFGPMELHFKFERTDGMVHCIFLRGHRSINFSKYCISFSEDIFVLVNSDEIPCSATFHQGLKSFANTHLQVSSIHRVYPKSYSIFSRT